MIIKGRDALGGRDYEFSCDVAIAGSGASGAIAARELTAAGLDVIVLEEGPWFSNEEKRNFSVTESMYRLYRNQGATFTMGLGGSPSISLTMGWGPGGSSVLTGGVCYRVPDTVVDDWVGRLGLSDLAPDKMAPFYETIEDWLSIGPTPEKMWGKGNRKIIEGCNKLDYEVKVINRNMTDACRGCGRCNFVCPHGAKTSVDISALPHAMQGGATLICEARATKLQVRNCRATGLSGVLLNEHRKPHARFKIKAKTVLLAMGSVHTSAFMLKNGVGNGSGQLGRGMTLHPGFRTYGLFDEELNANQSALQPIYVDKFMPDITFNAIYVPEAIMMATLPGIGAKNREFAQQRPNIAAFGAMIHDGPNGRIVPTSGPDPMILYRMPVPEKNLAVKAMQMLAEIFFAAGAKQVLTGFHGLERFENMDQVRAVDADQIKGNQIECAAFHPLGTARMGHSSEDSVVDVWGRVHGMQGLYVIDGSVFPTALSVNSQLPIMAMALRMATHLHQEERRLFADQKPERHEGANPLLTFENLAKASTSRLKRLFDQGVRPDPDKLAGWEFRGWNTPYFTKLVGIQKFKKGFYRVPGEQRFMGYNRPIRVNGLDLPHTGKPTEARSKPFGWYSVAPVDADSKENKAPHALLLNYGVRKNGLAPPRLLRDYLVQVDPDNPDLYLGKAYLALGPLRVFSNFFILERYNQATYDPAQDPKGHRL
ncbi:MAG: GMC family oxidoreductase [Candidatus Alcyoniella australis]|nr:GMC family oxidoreductase [Candidatus Alcyoniella australis]